MSYWAKTLGLFEFHDAQVESYKQNGDALLFHVTALNIHKHTPQNTADYDMKIEEADIRFSVFALESFVTGECWTTDEYGSITIKEAQAFYGADASNRFKTECKKGFTILSLKVHDLERNYCCELECIKNGSFFTIRFSFSEVDIYWEKYKSKAWYELHRQYKRPVLISINGNEQEQNVYVVCNDENEEEAPVRTVEIQVEGATLRGSGETLECVLLNLERQLPAYIKMKCCQTCRHGNFCAVGNEENEIFCLKDQTPTRIDDIFFFTEDQHETTTRSMELLSACEDYKTMERSTYTYNDYFYICYPDAKEGSEDS